MAAITPAPAPTVEDAALGAERQRTERAAKRRDPHGTEPAEAAAKDEPMALPNSDRHLTETASGKAPQKE